MVNFSVVFGLFRLDRTAGNKSEVDCLTFVLKQYQPIFYFCRPHGNISHPVSCDEFFPHHYWHQKCLCFPGSLVLIIDDASYLSLDKRTQGWWCSARTVPLKLHVGPQANEIHFQSIADHAYPSLLVCMYLNLFPQAFHFSQDTLIVLVPHQNIPYG